MRPSLIVFYYLPTNVATLLPYGLEFRHLDFTQYSLIAGFEGLKAIGKEWNNFRTERNEAIVPAYKSKTDLHALILSVQRIDHPNAEPLGIF